MGQHTGHAQEKLAAEVKKLLQAGVPNLASGNFHTFEACARTVPRALHSLRWKDSMAKLFTPFWRNPFCPLLQTDRMEIKSTRKQHRYPCFGKQATG